MATITVKSIIDKAANQLFDIPNIKWSRSELLGWVNVAQRLVVIMQPSSTNTIEVIPLVAGTRQHLPTHGWLLLDVLRNYSALTGGTAGRAVRVVSRKLLDTFSPSWHSATATKVVQNYVFDAQDQQAFLVYPPNTGTGFLEINYSTIPADTTNETDMLSIPDAYEDAILNYVLFRACGKQTDFAGGAQLADGYLTIVNNLLGSKLTAEQANNPNLGLIPNPAGVGGTS